MTKEKFMEVSIHHSYAKLIKTQTIIVKTLSTPKVTFKFDGLIQKQLNNKS